MAARYASARSSRSVGFLVARRAIVGARIPRGLDAGDSAGVHPPRAAAADQRGPRVPTAWHDCRRADQPPAGGALVSAGADGGASWRPGIELASIRRRRVWRWQATSRYSIS